MVVITKYVIINTCESLSKRDKGIHFDKLSYGLEMFSLVIISNIKNIMRCQKIVQNL